MILRWRCLIESESGAMGPASIVNDLQPEQTEKSGLHNLTLKAYSPAYACYTSKRLINLPLISPHPPTSLPLRVRNRGGGFTQIVCGLHGSRRICLMEPFGAAASPAAVCLSVFCSTLGATGKQLQRDARSHTGLNWIVFFPAVLPLMA